MIEQETTKKSDEKQQIESVWKLLEQLAAKVKSERLTDLFEKDAQRATRFSLAIENLYLDYSKNFVSVEIMSSLVKLAELGQVKQAIRHLLEGGCVNSTEGRPALHTALRREMNEPLWVAKEDIMPKIKASYEKMSHIVSQIRQGTWKGATNEPIKDIVSLGIGGSDLGPQMAMEALKAYQNSDLNLHFVSNIDPVEILAVLEKLNPATTLFIISSKSFTTTETLTNALVAKQWLTEKLNTTQLDQHFIALTANPEKAINWGLHPENVLIFWEWVGGRYSIWSVIGLPLALAIGMEHFDAFLSGARMMDEHFSSAALAENMPVLLALMGVWYIRFWDASTIAILPYSSSLRRFPDYLQQLDMESNGKTVQKSGNSVSFLTGPIVWGQSGTNGQHAFYQLLHQGAHFTPIDFILPIETSTPLKAQHQQLLANGIAQAQALMRGNNNEEGLPQDEMSGNRPSNTLLLNALTPFTLGQLIALYEHKVFVQGVIWQINSFDQPGVELGKKLAKEVLKSMESGKPAADMDASTYQLIHRCIK